MNTSIGYKVTYVTLDGQSKSITVYKSSIGEAVSQVYQVHKAHFILAVQRIIEPSYFKSIKNEFKS